MSSISPALEFFLASVPDTDGLGFAQAWISRAGCPGGFEVRHVLDRHEDTNALRPLNPAELRKLAHFDVNGAFRPLRSSPDLVQGWIYKASSPQALEEGIQELYPGAIADFYSAREGAGAAISYRDYCNRQTGMYRITAMLSDMDAARAAKACCASRFCLKRRLWTIPGLPEDGAGEKSLVPCLEPCALMMEFARKAFRVSEEPSINLSLKPSELETILEVLRSRPDEKTEIRHADFGHPRNPRRIEMALMALPATPAEPPIAG
ncbi:MAG: hypothetical protein FJ405_10205 [Verrucomicrobia bacterium]|nr:hypothetical protein [Verrucomicrobiota bacterium]